MMRNRPSSPAAAHKVKSGENANAAAQGARTSVNTTLLEPTILQECPRLIYKTREGKATDKARRTHR